MSVSQQARASRIDTTASQSANSASNLNSQLNSLCDEALAFSAFMHTDPRGEFTQADKDKYSAVFAEALANIKTTLVKLDVLEGIQDNTVTVDEFLAGYSGDITGYSERFDRG